MGSFKENKSERKTHQAIVSTYNVVKSKVRGGNDLTELFMGPRGLKQGEKCSPVLFSLFIDEIADEIMQRGKRGIQLLPDLVKMFILLFADDVILVSDTVCGLQNQLNVLCNTANHLGPVVNLDKSSIFVFRNGGHTALCEKWKYGDTPLRIVNVYKYLGIYLSIPHSFSHELNGMSQRAKKGVNCIFKLLRSMGERSPSIFFKVFDA